MITDLGHTAFSVSDIDRSIEFYAKFGIHEAFRLHREDGSLMLVYLHIGGDRFLELFPGRTEGDSSGPQSFKHICLLTDDTEAMVSELETAGVPIDRPPKRGLDGNLQAWTHDPDGNQIELMQLVESSPQRRAARGE